MKKIILITLSLLFLLNHFAFSQVYKGSDSRYFTNSSADNWFISAGGGVNLYDGTEDFKYFSQYNISPAVDFSFGHYMLPSFGFRFQINGLQGYGWSTSITPYSSDVITAGLYKEKFFYTGAHFDLLWNVLDMGDNYKESRVFKLIPFLGAGAVASFKGSLKPTFGVAVTGGFIFNFRASRIISLNIELRGTANDGRIDKVNTLPTTEIMCSASGGIQFHINPVKYQRRVEMESSFNYEIDILKKSLKKQEKEIADKNGKIKELNERYLQLLKENGK